MLLVEIIVVIIITLTAYYVPDITVSAFHTIFYLIFTTILLN